VVNWVDEANDHHFESYTPRDTQDVLVAHLFNLCDLDVDAPDPKQVPQNPTEMEKIMEQMKQMVMLMSVNGMQTPEQTPRALGWFVSGRQVWLMQKDEKGEPLVPKLASREDLKLAISGLVQQALADPALAAN